MPDNVCDDTYVRQTHGLFYNLSEIVLTIFSANGNVVATIPCIIPPFCPGGINTIRVNKFFHCLRGFLNCCVPARKWDVVETLHATSLQTQFRPGTTAKI